MQAIVVQAPPESETGFECYGAARDFWRYRGPEAIISGPYETGKTISALHKLHLQHCKYAGARGLMVRKTYQSLVNSAVVTFERKVLPVLPDAPESAVSKFGGEKPEFYDYPNGARLVLGGMDNADKFLSAEFDFIYVNQAEELTLDDWEKLSGRATGRAGNAPYSQLYGDCNPAHPQHWILQRPRLKVFYSRHEDNPALFDQPTGKITDQGKRTLDALDALTGVRKSRGRHGLWVAAEGQVYSNWDPAVNYIDRFPIPDHWRRILGFDFGYTNPFVAQCWAVTPDGAMVLYREIYMTRRTVAGHIPALRAIMGDDKFEIAVADHDAEDRATLEEFGIRTIPANKEISPGIQEVQERMKQEPATRRPRLYIMRDSTYEIDPALKAKFLPTSTVEEIPVYVWAQGVSGKPNKEIPVDKDNHGLDTMRYVAMYLRNPGVLFGFG